MKKHKTLSILAVVFFSLLIPIIKGETENSIILTTPSKWLCNPSQPQTLLFDFLDAQKLKIDSLNLNITLVSRNSSVKQTVLQKVDSLNKNALKLITFNIPEFFETGKYDLELTATNEQSAYEFKRKLTNIECSVNGLGLYIMTDKAVYRASDLVRIKVVYIDSSLNPYDGKLATVNILDPNGFQVQRFVDRKFRSGLIDGLDFQLSDRPIYGKWTIQLIVDGIIKESELTVKEYVLPNFVISLKGPKYLLRSAKSFDGNVEVKYSNGNSFDGMVNIRLIRDYKAPNKDGDKLEKKQDVLFEDDVKIVKSKSKFTVALKPRIEYDGIKLIATVTDSVSKQSASRELPIVFYKQEFYVSYNTKSFFPGESNQFEISLLEVNKKPYANREMILTINEYTSWTSIDKRPLLVTEKKLTTDSNGELDYFMDIEGETRVLSIQLSPVSDSTQKVLIFIEETKEDPNQSDIRFWIFPSFSETNTEPELTPNSIANITLHKSKQFDCVDTRYLVIGKSQILNYGTINLCDEVTVRIQLAPIHAPYSTFIAYFISSKGQLVTTSYQIEIPNFYRNQLTINMGKAKSFKPGETVEIRVKSQPQSLIALRVVDRTALEMMGKTGEIDTAGINSQITGLYQPDYNQNIPSPSQMNAYLNSPAIFERTSVMATLNKLGLAVASDIGNLQLFIKNNDDSVTKPSSQIGESDSTQTRSGSLLNGQKSDNEDDDLLVENNDLFVRKVDSRIDFKEVWIWDTISLEDNKEKTIQSKLPETMTSWIASGFSLHPELGIAIAAKKQITASKDFFISTILPSSVTRGETIRLQVVLFNNMDADLINIQVGLEKSSDFEMSSDSVQLVERVEKQSTQTVEFVVTPLKLGRLKLVISASSSSVSDGEVRFVNVNNGVNSEQSVVSTQRTQTFLAAFTLGVARIVKDVDVQFPSDVVSGSQVCSIQVVGDILGPTYNRTQSIIQFKRNEGGDTNMIRFTWNLYALHYMSSAKNVKNIVPNIDRLVSSAKQNIIYMFERELRFSRKDGSFNIDNDSTNGSGSTWLTAFILNSFVQAKQYLPDDIDGSVINKAAEFLRAQQKDDGWFEEKSPINDRSIRGGLSGRTPLTAYVISALIENKLATKGNVRKALAYLEAEAPKVKQLYTLGLVVNALDLAKSSLADEYFALFESRSNKTDDGMIYWRATDREELSSINTELTGYGLLMSLRRKNVVEVLPIVRYLVSKMNPNGGFYDTQDTALGLGTLAAYNNKLQSATSSRNLKVDVTIDNDLSSKQTLVVNDQNEFVLQTIDLATCPKTVKFLGRGSGSAIFQFVTRYNLSK